MITWYAAYTQPNQETRALENLARQGYQVYLPRCRRWVRHARRRSAVLRPLFPRYLFVGLDRLTERWRPIRSTVGVVGLVSCGEDPLPVAPNIIEELRNRESKGAFDMLAPVRRLATGAPVRVTEGVLADLVGRFLGMADHDRVYVLLELLGRSVRAEVSALAVDAA